MGKEGDYMEKKDYCVIGCGRFGKAIIETLVKEGHSVMAIDSDREKVNAMAQTVSYAATLDSTDEEALKAIGIQDMDHVVVAIGGDIESSIMTCALLRELDIKNITAKAVSGRHARVLLKMGVNDVVRPETESGKRTATRIMHSFLGEFVSVSQEHSIVQIRLENRDIAGVKLIDLSLRDKGINVVALKRENVVEIPTAETTFALGDIIIMIGKNTDIAKAETYLKG